MNAQTDMFSLGGARSLAPYHDPFVVGAVSVRPDVDRDHVGAEDVGKFGNNALVWVVEVMSKAGEVIFAQSCASEREAATIANAIGRKVEGNQQAEILFA